jgi:hypothetical protein
VRGFDKFTVFCKVLDGARSLGWWLMLIYCERKLLMVGWWLVLWYMRKVLMVDKQGKQSDIV